MQENLAPVVTAQEKVVLEDTMSMPWVLPTHLRSPEDESWADKIILLNPEHRPVLKIGRERQDNKTLYIDIFDSHTLFIHIFPIQ